MLASVLALALVSVLTLVLAFVLVLALVMVGVVVVVMVVVVLVVMLLLMLVLVLEGFAGPSGPRNPNDFGPPMCMQMLLASALPVPRARQVQKLVPS